MPPRRAGTSFPSTERDQLLSELLARESGLATAADRISRRDDSSSAPMSFNQEGLWFIEQMEPGTSVYNIPATVLLKGKLDVGALGKSLNAIVRRHESLRTTFEAAGDGELRQRIHPYTPAPLITVELSTVPESERLQEAVRRAAREAQTPFDLTHEPLFRASLLRLGDREHVLALRIHHMVCDGWSMGVFTRELESLYGAFVAGDPSPLPDLPIQFGDFAAWERRRMIGTTLQDHLAYWREQLAGVPEDSLLPTDRPRPQEPSFAGAHLPIRLSNPLSREIRASSRRAGVTVFHTLLAAFNVLLYSMSGQEDVVVGTTFANRAHTQLEGLIGYFVNVLPLRSDLSGNPRFDELQRRACEITLAVSAHQELSLVKLVRELQPERDLSRNPLFQVVFYYLTLDHNPAVYGFGISPVLDVVELPGLTMTPLDFECGIARFDIAILIWDTPQGLSGTIEYSTALFDASTIKGLVDDYEAVVRHVTGEPQPRLKTVAAALATDREQRRDQRRESFRSRMQEKLQAISERPGARKG